MQKGAYCGRKWIFDSLTCKIFDDIHQNKILYFYIYKMGR